MAPWMTLNATDPNKSPTTERPTVQSVRQQFQSAVTTVVFITQASTDLTAYKRLRRRRRQEHYQQLQQLQLQLLQLLRKSPRNKSCEYPKQMNLNFLWL